MQKLEADYRVLENENRLQGEYYKKMQKNIDATSKIRHDINNLVQVINIQIAENTAESRSKATEIANEIEKIMSSTRTQKFCDNRIINTVLFDKSMLALKYGIKISDEIMLDEHSGIDNFDLCRVFINLLDNAINALKTFDKADNKIIFISCKQNSGYLYIKLENPYYETQQLPKINNDSVHGYGLKIVEDIADKYHGTLISKRNGTIFSALVTLKLPVID